MLINRTATVLAEHLDEPRSQAQLSINSNDARKAIRPSLAAADARQGSPSAGLAPRSCRLLRADGLELLCCSPIQPQGALTFGQLAPLKWLAMRLLPSA